MPYRSNRSAFVPVLAAFFSMALLAAAPVWAQLPRTRLSTIFPPGGQAGSDVAVTINGELAAAATELLFSHPGIEATQQIEGPGEFQAAHRKPRVFDVHIGEDVPNGRYEVWALGPAGLSNPRIFAVSRLPEKRFDAGANSRQTPFSLSVGEIVNATARGDKRDYYRFSAKASQSLLLQVQAERIDSRLDAVMAVFDMATGRRLGRVMQGKTRDPAMTFVAPTDGDYLLAIWDRTFRGGEEYHYRLEVSERPQVEGIFPPVAEEGKLSPFTVFGYNLPGGAAVASDSANSTLQALPLSFAPRFDHSLPLTAGLPTGVVAAAHVEGASLELPIPLSGAEKVFLERAHLEVTLEQEPNDDREHAQELHVPLTLAGQFYPRRDVDWYAFEAKKNQIFWIDLASHQLGTSADPILRVVKQTLVDGQPQYGDVATADDLEGPPSSRDTRRLYSGTGDCSLRFRADEDATYLIAVRDQYNVAIDDPSLVYRLRIEAPQEDFQLVAFADPERHADEKIAKPNGVSLFPGGTTVIRVRLLPLHGFKDTVRVTAENLPDGVTAPPITLNSRAREGLLVLAASAGAQPDVRSVRIVGTSHAVTDRPRIARAATLRRAANNLDNQLTYGRLSQDLLVAVVNSPPPPARLKIAAGELATSIGGRVKLPIELARKDGFQAEVELVALQVPRGIKVSSAKTKGDRAELDVQIEDAKLAAGRYTFPIAAKVKEKRPKNPLAVQEAEQDLEKIEQAFAARQQRLEAEQASYAALEKQLTAAKEELAEAQQQAGNPQGALSAKLQEQQQVAAELAKQLEALRLDLENNQLREQVAVLETRGDVLRQQRQQIEQQWATASQRLKAVAQGTATIERQHVEAQQQLDSFKAKLKDVEQKKAAAEKKLAEVRKAELEQEAEFWVYTPAVQLDVWSSPLSVRLPETVRVKRGEGPQAIPLIVQRKFGFQGQVRVEAAFDGSAGILVAPLVLGPGQEAAGLALQTSSDAPLGTREARVTFNLKFNNIEITDSATCQVELIAP